MREGRKDEQRGASGAKQCSTILFFNEIGVEKSFFNLKVNQRKAEANCSGDPGDHRGPVAVESGISGCTRPASFGIRTAIAGRCVG